MKFIGLPRNSKKRGISLISVLGFALTGILLVVCLIGFNSVFSGENIESEATSSFSFPSVKVDSPELFARSDDAFLFSETYAIDVTMMTTTIVAPTTESTPEVTTIATTSMPSESSAAGTYYPNGEVNVRTGPGTSFSISHTLQISDSLTVIARTDTNWYKIGEAQYVFGDNLLSTPYEEAFVGTYYAKEAINVRSGPGTNFDILKEISSGSAIDVVAKTGNGWYRTIVNSYVRMDLCTSEPPVVETRATTPSTSSPATNRPAPLPTTPTPNIDNSSLEKGEYLGSFKIVYYGPQLRPDGSYSITTASGATCVIGVTIAVDPRVIPLGSTVYIEGFNIADNGCFFVAQDTGSAIKGNIIDIFVSSEEEASKLNNGTYTDVYLVK